MTIGQLAKAAGVNVETIRYYQRVELIAEPPKPETGYRRYSTGILEELLFIRRAKDLGFSLNDIKELLALRDKPNVCREMCAATERILGNVRTRIKDLQNLETTLVGLLEGCSESTECLILQTLQPPPCCHKPTCSS
jgi:MerR family transcriptional regulator, mercuric resistance operon regulatory protein